MIIINDTLKTPIFTSTYVCEWSSPETMKLMERVAKQRYLLRALSKSDPDSDHEHNWMSQGPQFDAIVGEIKRDILVYSCRSCGEGRLDVHQDQQGEQQ